MSNNTEKNTSKKKYWLGILIFCILFTSLILYSRFVSTSGLKINEIKITNSKIPDAFHGVKVVHISDIHFGTVVKDKLFKNIVSKIKILKPHILIFTGDLIDKNYTIRKTDLKLINQELKSLEIPIGKYAVLGEDDYKNNDTLNILEDNNFNILKNNTEFIYNQSNSYISISGFGINEYRIDKMDLKEDIFNILITHKGDYLKDITNFDLALGGHSHNGQIQLPFFGSIYNKNGSKIYNKTHYEVNKKDIYISNGIGTSDYNFRFFNKPSINFFRLTQY